MNDAARRGLEGLRRDAARAQRRPERGLMIAIGLAEPEEEEGEGEGASSKGSSLVNKDHMMGGADDIAAEMQEGDDLPPEYIEGITRDDAIDGDQGDEEKDAELRRRRR